MTTSASTKPLVDQIIDRWLEDLENTKEFDPPTIERLRQLASSRALKNHSRVRKAIKVVSGVEYETH